MPGCPTCGQNKMRHLERLESALVSGDFRLLPFATLQEHNLAAYAYTTTDHPHKTDLGAAFYQATAHHSKTKHELDPLFRAWREAGLEVMVFKGFQLAEYVYPSSGQRFYNDVDLIFREKDATQASTIAKDLGWHLLWERSHSDKPYSHAMFHLAAPSHFTKIDAHRFALQALSPLVARQKRMTEKVWAAAKKVPWRDSEILTPCPADMVLVGLVLNRFWSPDHWTLRSHDYTDFRFVVERFGLTKVELEARAASLGCSRTLRLFLNRCDPWEKRLNLRPPTRFERNLWTLLIIPERGYLYAEDVVMRGLVRPLLERLLVNKGTHG